jgi:hypothetical protein
MAPTEATSYNESSMTRGRILLYWGAGLYVTSFIAALIWLPFGGIYPRNIIAMLIVAPVTFSIFVPFVVPRIVRYRRRPTSGATLLALLKFYWPGLTGIILILSVVVAWLIAPMPH